MSETIFLCSAAPFRLNVFLYIARSLFYEDVASFKATRNQRIEGSERRFRISNSLISSMTALTTSSPGSKVGDVQSEM